jgi:hypothetical protein
MDTIYLVNGRVAQINHIHHGLSFIFYYYITFLFITRNQKQPKYAVEIKKCTYNQIRYIDQ